MHAHTLSCFVMCIYTMIKYTIIKPRASAAFTLILTFLVKHLLKILKKVSNVIESIFVHKIAPGCFHLGLVLGPELFGVGVVLQVPLPLQDGLPTLPQLNVRRGCGDNNKVKSLFLILHKTFTYYFAQYLTKQTIYNLDLSLWTKCILNS